jgi:hypothetical protein
MFISDWCPTRNKMTSTTTTEGIQPQNHKFWCQTIVPASPISTLESQHKIWMKLYEQLTCT